MQQRRNTWQEILLAAQTIRNQQDLAAFTTQYLTARLSGSKRTLYQILELMVHKSLKERLRAPPVLPLRGSRHNDET